MTIYTRDTLCYILSVPSGYIKVGHSADPLRRMAEIQREFYEPITLDATTGAAEMTQTKTPGQIHRLEDGRLLIVGDKPSLNNISWSFWEDVRCADHEAGVIISPDLLDEIKAEAVREYLVQATSESDRPNGDHLVTEQAGIEIDHLGGNCPVQAKRIYTKR